MLATVVRRNLRRRFRAGRSAGDSGSLSGAIFAPQTI
jgi:hypothetical protein